MTAKHIGWANKNTRNSHSSSLLQLFSSWQVLPILITMGVVVGIWFGLAHQSGESQLGQSHIGQSQLGEMSSVDRALVEGVRAALPIPQNGTSDEAVSKTFQSIPWSHMETSGGVPLVNQQTSPPPAYLVATDGARLKTIVTR